MDCRCRRGCRTLRIWGTGGVRLLVLSNPDLSAHHRLRSPCLWPAQQPAQPFDKANLVRSTDPPLSLYVIWPIPTYPSQISPPATDSWEPALISPRGGARDNAWLRCLSHGAGALFSHCLMYARCPTRDLARLALDVLDITHLKKEATSGTACAARAPVSLCVHPQTAAISG